MKDQTGIAVISSEVSPDWKNLPFIFDEARRLVANGLRVHCIRLGKDFQRERDGVWFHSSNQRLSLKLLKHYIKSAAILPLRSLPMKLYIPSSYSLHASKIIKRFNLDLIHAHFAFIEGFVGLLTKRECGKPLVVTVHGRDINTVPEIRYGVRLVNRYDTLVRKVLRNADEIVAVSRDLYEKCISLGAHENRTFLVPNCVDTTMFSPSVNASEIRNRLLGDNKIIVFTARHLWPVYGIEYMIKAARMVQQKYTDTLFVIAGEGPLRGQVEGMISEMGLTRNVKLVGYLSREVMPYYMAACDIYVNCSLSEGFGLSTLEAMASGKPVVATRVGGTLDLVMDHKNGLLCNPKDPVDIAAKIGYLIENPEEAKKMGSTGRRIAQEKFNINKHISKIIDIYRQLMNR